MSIALQNLAYAYETRILVSIASEPPTLHNPDLAIFGHEADIAIRSLRSTNGFQILQNLSRSPTAIKLPLMAPLELTCAKAGTLLRNVNEVRLMQKLGRQRARFCVPELSGFAVEAWILNSRIRSAQEAKIIAAVCKREQKREKIIQQCFLHAEWAGSDLERWDRLFVEYKKYPKRLKILTGLIEDAHSRFLGILAETRKMSEIQDRCGHNPILLREFEILKEEIARYKASQAELEKQEGFAEDADMSREQEDEGQNAYISESSMRM